LARAHSGHIFKRTWGSTTNGGEGSGRERSDARDQPRPSRLRIVGAAAARLNPELIYLAVRRTGQRVFLDRRDERRPGDEA
jgi:hypothetical protein